MRTSAELKLPVDRQFDVMTAPSYQLRHVRALMLAACVLFGFTAAHAQTPILLSDNAGRIDVWPAVTTLTDPSGQLTIDTIRDKRPNFVVPVSAYATLGFKYGVEWLHVPLRVADNSDGDWIRDIDYALLNRVDVFFVSNGLVVKTLRLGNDQNYASRPLASRSLAAEVMLKPGADYDVFMRIDTIGAKILPITFSKLSSFHRNALNEQMLQGFLTSLGVCLLLFSLLQWVSLRETMYLKYALLISASILFSVHFFGIGEQYLWTDHDWLEKHLAGITSLLAASATALFIDDVLGYDYSRRLRMVLRAVAAILALAALAHAFDVIDIHQVGLFMGTLGLMPVLLGIPGAITRIHRRDSIGTYFFIAWIGYFVASAIMVGVVKGYIGANFWTLHSFQFGATLDMIVFLRIAVLRSAVVHVAARRANNERDTLISLAHTDSLTGLLNRRGLNEILVESLKSASPGQQLVVFVMDLDRFKPVNDQYGHDVGDQLLILVASRLRGAVRGADIVARFGGDEFVVMATGLQNEQQATELAAKLVAAIATPFALETHICTVGATLGYAIAPVDGHDASTLIKMADAAMYTGKQAGRNCARRAAPV